MSGIRDMDNSSDLIKGDADLLRFSASYDDDNLYVVYEVESEITGGTIDPPYTMLYEIKITNPDIHQGEGLMVGMLWLFLPLYDDPDSKDKFFPLLEQNRDSSPNYNEALDWFYETGMMVLDIGTLMGGSVSEGIVTAAAPEGIVKENGTVFVGRIKREALGENPSGYLRLIVFTAVNASIDSFMPIPLNCTNFLSIYTSNYSYIVK